MYSRWCALLLPILVAACDQGRHDLQLVYPSQALFDRGRTVELYVGEQLGCAALQAADPPPRLLFDAHAAYPELGPVAVGQAAFRVRVRDRDCLVFLGGCVEAEIARGKNQTVEVALAEIPASGCGADEQCVQARCSPADAGRADAPTADRGLADGSAADRRDAAAADALLDGGLDASLDGGQDASRDGALDDAGAADGGAMDAVAADRHDGSVDGATGPCLGALDGVACTGGVCEAEQCVPIPRRGLVGEWLLDEGSGTVAHDSSGHGGDGAFVGAPSWTSGRFDLGVRLHYQDGWDWVALPASAALENVQENSFTLAAWFWPASTPPNPDANADDGAYAVIAKQSMSVAFDHHQRFAMQIALASNDYPTAVGPTSYPTGHWYHVAGVLDRAAGTFTIYVDGVVERTTGFTPNAALKEYAAVPWLIGTRREVGSGARYDADGVVDQARIYDRALNVAEVRALAAEVVIPRRGLVGEWRLDEGSGSIAHDSAGAADGTFLGAPTWLAGVEASGIGVHYQDGVDAIVLPNTSALENVQEASYTLSAWFRPGSIPPGTDTVDFHDTNYALLAKYNSGGVTLSYTRNQHFSLQIRLQGSSPGAYGGSGAHPPDRWYHVAGVVDRPGGVIALYVDGALDAAQSFDPGALEYEYGTAPWYLGTRDPSAGQYRFSADGALDLVRIYDRALDRSEIEALAAEAAP